MALTIISNISVIVSGERKKCKDITNTFPFKDKILEEIAETKRQNEEINKERKELIKQQRRERKENIRNSNKNIGYEL